MSDETCPVCGELLVVRKLSGRGSVMSAGHEVDGPTCRLVAWSREVERRGLVRVIGQVASYLYDRGLVTYGPFLLTAEQAARDAEIMLAEGSRRASDPVQSLAQKRVTSAFTPRWAYEVARTYGTVVGDALCKTSEKLEFVRKSGDLQQAIVAAASLADDASDARKNVAAVVRAAIQEVKTEAEAEDRRG